MIFILSNIIGCLSLTSCFYQEPEQQAADLAKKPIVLLSQSHSKNNYEFNEVAYDIMHNQFIAVGGKKDGRPLIVSSPDGLIWTQHNIAIPGKVTSMLITQHGNLFIDIEEPGTTDSSVYQ